MLATLYMMLRGTPFIYQGQEIGMENIRMDCLEDYDDVASYDQYERAVSSGVSKEEALEVLFRRSRDNARTPMQWSDGKNAGFSEADDTWLKVNANYKTINVEQEQKEPESVLNYYKKLIALRKSGEYGDVIVNGRFVPVENTGDAVIAYKRVTEEQEIWIAVNMSDKEERIIAGQFQEPLLSNVENDIRKEKDEILLPPYGAVIF